MTMRLRAALVLAVMGALAGWGQADSQDGSGREERREQLQRSRALLSEALEQIDAGDDAAAEETLRAVLEIDAANADAHYLLGRTLLAGGDSAAAVAIVAQGVELAPFSTRLKLLLARVQLATGGAEEAGALLDDVLRIHARDGEALYLRGLAHLALGDSVAALSVWRKSLAIAAGDPTS